MAQTQTPGDGEAERAQGAGDQGSGGPEHTDENTRQTSGAQGAGPDTEESPLLPPDQVFTPSRGTAAPLGTLGGGRYRITHRLGRGGMAEVYAAQDVRLGRTVAIKLLRSDLAQDDVARLRFTREAHAVAALNHHSIVSVYDTGEEELAGDSTPYIVMELVEGHTVRELLMDEDAPPVDQALIITAGVLEALAYSHRNGIVHRDIKPANVIITNTGAVKVMDFGIARALTGGATTMTQTGMVMGTPQYLSPEQALGKAVDHRSDLYAAGCMLYELLTLRPPFTGDTPLSVVYQHVQDMPVPPSQANSRVPAALDDLVLRSLAKNPDDRFQSADEFRAHVQHALREMHGAASAAFATGPTAVVPGIPGQGYGDATAVTTALGSVDGPGAGVATPNDQTAMMPYPAAAAQYNAPSSPYPGGSYDGGHGGGYQDDGYGHEGDGRKRKPWALLGGLVALFAVVAIGAAMALSPGGSKHDYNQTPKTGTSQSQSTEPTDTPDTSAPSPLPMPSHSIGGNTNPNRNSPPPEWQDTQTPPPTPGRSAGASGSPTPSSSASAPVSAPPSDSPTDQPTSGHSKPPGPTPSGGQSGPPDTGKGSGGGSGGGAGGGTTNN
ncbi:protein kinase domain-containing protein [Kitasatospora sp. HPMI-4]|uniref:protein kinase domain-containing protein n=1 Tax=Kitasatospora sp. HPMI-4 TaxID=3448443 RepID=UPI003F1C6CCD